MCNIIPTESVPFATRYRSKPIIQNSVAVPSALSLFIIRYISARISKSKIPVRSKFGFTNVLNFHTPNNIKKKNTSKVLVRTVHDWCMMVQIFALLPVIMNEHELLDLLLKVCNKNGKKGENVHM